MDNSARLTAWQVMHGNNQEGIVYLCLPCLLDYRQGIGMYHLTRIGRCHDPRRVCDDCGRTNTDCWEM